MKYRCKDPVPLLRPNQADVVATVGGVGYHRVLLARGYFYPLMGGSVLVWLGVWEAIIK